MPLQFDWISVDDQGETWLTAEDGKRISLRLAAEAPAMLEAIKDAQVYLAKAPPSAEASLAYTRLQSILARIEKGAR